MRNPLKEAPIENHKNLLAFAPVVASDGVHARFCDPNHLGFTNQYRR